MLSAPPSPSCLSFRTPTKESHLGNTKDESTAPGGGKCPPGPCPGHQEPTGCLHAQAGTGGPPFGPAPGREVYSSKAHSS